MESFNKKYTSDLTEDDWKLLKEINSSINKEELFNRFKTECVNKLTEAQSKFEKDGTIEEQKKVSSVLEKIKAEVDRIIEADYPIRRVTVVLAEALEVYKNLGYELFESSYSDEYGLLKKIKN